MSHRKRAFKASARPAFFDPSSDGGLPPDFSGGAPPDGGHPDWPLPAPGLMRARTPVAIEFLGTTGKDTVTPEAAEDNRRLLEQAIFILSQSATGRALLEDMTAEGFRVVFDDTATGEKGAGGLCDPNKKLLILRHHNSAEYLALLIGHEAVHAVQNARHNLFPSSQHRPDTGIRMSFAIEADAYAQQTQIALELAYGDPKGPSDQWRMQEPLRQMRNRFPDLVLAAEKVMLTSDALENGRTVAAAFEAFYDNFHLRTFYEDMHVSWVDSVAPRMKPPIGKISRHFNKAVNSGRLKQHIMHRGKPYLEIHTPNLDLDDARHAGVSDVTAGKIEAFYKKHMAKSEILPELKRYGVHMKNAAGWMSGLVGQMSVVFHRKASPANDLKSRVGKRYRPPPKPPAA